MSDSDSGSGVDFNDLMRRVVDERMEERFLEAIKVIASDGVERVLEARVDGEFYGLKRRVEDMRRRLEQVAAGRHVMGGTITVRDHLNELEDRIAALEAGVVDYKPGAIMQTPHGVDLDDAESVDIEDHREVAKVLDRVIRRHLEGVHLRVLVAGLVHAWLFEAQADSLQGLDTLRGARDALRGIFRDAAHMLQERSNPEHRYTMEEFLADKEEGFDSGDG